MTTRFAVICWALIAVFGISSSSAGQVSAPGSSVAYIPGFSGLSWATAENAIVAVHGRPLLREPDDDGRNTLFYRDSILGEEVTAAYYIAPDKGLVGGAYFITLDRPADCLRIFEKFEAAVGARYPMIEPIRTAPSVTRSSVCDVALAVSGTLQSFYRDQMGGTVLISVYGGRLPTVTVEYSSPSLTGTTPASPARTTSRF